MSSKIDTKRIAKNTSLLYVRMFITLVVSLFTSRIVLNTLGVEDYGIYNVVGGIITLFSVVNSAMTTATQRYITFELGKDDIDRIKSVFSTSIQIHFCISVIIFFLAESIGVWFLCKKMNIPEERFDAAFWVYQCSIISSLISVMTVPYNAVIIAHEKMSAFAYISVFEVLLKLVIVFLLYISPFDKLKSYAVMMLIIYIMIRCIYGRYCTKHFVESKYQHRIDYLLLKEMFGFASWCFLGNFASVLYNQGLNILLNIFFGPAVNAARGIAVQVQGVVRRFVSNFQMALNPQITKCYASNRLSDMHLLMFRSARLSFYLLFFLCLPVIIEADIILTLWLKIVPKHTDIFLRIILCVTLIYSVANPLIAANHATGKVKNYQIVCGSILLAILPVSYFFLRLDFPPYVVFIVHFIFEIVCQFARMYMLRNLIHLPIVEYFKHIYIRIILVASISFVIPYLIHINMGQSIVRLIFVILSSFISVLITCYFIGLEKNEKYFLRKVLYSKLISR
jgi:O-antigen/teichoic acid export membrane protein